MKIIKRKEVTHVTVDEVIVGRKCDFCEKDISISSDGYNYNYFVVHTYHNDWGNDSIESHEYFDACCPECVTKFVNNYLADAFERLKNSKVIEIKHVRSLKEGAVSLI